MIEQSPPSSPPPHGPDKAISLALSLAQAERAIQAFTHGQVDAIVNPEGETYLLRPAQEHLRQNERRLQAVLDSAADVITVVNRGGTILSQSKAARPVLGYEADEQVGSNLFDQIHEEDMPAVHFAFFGVVEFFRGDTTVRFRHRTRYGSWRHIEATIGILRGHREPSVVFSLRPVSGAHDPRPEPAPPEIASPVTPAHERFLAMLSHELRTPLTPVLLAVEEMLEDAHLAAARPLLTTMQRNLNVQLRLLEELFTFTTVGQHKVRVSLESLDAHAHVHYVLEICRSDLATGRIAVQLDLRATAPLVLADSVRLQQVMWNLVKNAIKFSPPGGTLFITSANTSTDGLLLEFSDHGIGIDPVLLPRIFDALQQGDHPGPPVGSGLGLGLFIARGLAEAQGATLTAHSAGRGQGATFCLTLPGVPGTPAPAAVGESA